VKGKLMNKRKFLILIAPWLVMSCYTVFQHPLVPYVDKLGLDANAYSEEVATLMAEVSAKEDCLRCHSDDLPTVWLREQRTVAANPALSENICLLFRSHGGMIIADWMIRYPLRESKLRARQSALINVVAVMPKIHLPIFLPPA
jgi:hypothetical protein